jgi:hypothetical protein
VIAEVRAATPPPDAIRQQAHDILARPEFQHRESILQRFLDWIGDQLNRFSFGVGHGPGFVGDLFGLIFLAAAIVLVVVLVRAFRTSPGPPDEDELTIEEEVRRTASEWRSDAERHEAEQRWREAMRARYRELVRMLVDDGVLADVPGRTTGEYDTELAAARPAAGVAFAEVTERFDAVWYGGRETDADEYVRFRELTGLTRDRTRAMAGVS